MNSPRIKIFTRSFDLRLYRLAKGLFDDMRDKEGRPIPCVRLTDQTADGYFYTMLKDTYCDIAINIDEDAFVVDPDAILDLVDTVVKVGYANAGCSDTVRGGFDAKVTNPFFNVLNLSLIRTRFDRKALKRRADDAEPYYPFFRWIADSFPILYLPAEYHSDGITTVVMDHQGRTLCMHTWFARFYSMPSWIVRRIQPAQGKQKTRINAIIAEVYGLRGLPIPHFGITDYLSFAGNKIMRWLIKIPQRVAGWPRKIRKSLNARR